VIRVVVADDHPAVRMGTVHVLERARDIRVVGEAGEPAALLAMLGTTPCDVLVTDFSMPGHEAGDGLAMLSKVQRTHPDVKILVVTGLSHPSLLAAIVDAGCQGICDKQAPLSDVAVAVRELADDGTWFSPSVQARLDEEAAIPSGGSLSPRELEVVRLFAEGMSVDDIAERLHRSNKTVSRQKVDAMQRLGLHSDDALILYARAHHLA
jgi:two-component system, NarL family, captular synthesis response regulator RcsB